MMSTPALPLLPEIWQHEIVGRHLAACRFYTRAALRCTSRAFAALVPPPDDSRKEDEWCELLPVCSVARVVAWAGPNTRGVAITRAAMRIDDWDKFQQLGRVWRYMESSYSFYASWTTSEKWHLCFFECDWARDAEIALHDWFHVALKDCVSHVFSMIVQHMLKNPKNDRAYVWDEHIVYLIRCRTLADWLDLPPDFIRRAYSDELIREKRRGIDGFVRPYLFLVDNVTTIMRSHLRRRMDVICADHAEVERRLFPVAIK
jgi:hypothetical protein